MQDGHQQRHDERCTSLRLAPKHSSICTPIECRYSRMSKLCYFLGVRYVEEGVLSADPERFMISYAIDTSTKPGVQPLNTEALAA